MGSVAYGFGFLVQFGKLGDPGLVSSVRFGLMVLVVHSRLQYLQLGFFSAGSFRSGIRLLQCLLSIGRLVASFRHQFCSFGCLVSADWFFRLSACFFMLVVSISPALSCSLFFLLAWLLVFSCPFWGLSHVVQSKASRVCPLRLFNLFFFSIYKQN